MTDYIISVRNQVAQKDFDKFAIAEDVSTITCRFKDKKRAAITIAKDKYRQWYVEFKESKNPITYLQTLPCIGKVMSLHLARNLGFDCVKPDIWMNRLAAQYGFFKGYNNDVPDPEYMCRDIQRQLPMTNGCHEYRIGTIDFILWRDCNLRGSV